MSVSEKMPGEPLEVRFTMGLAAIFSGTCIGVLLTAVFVILPLVVATGPAQWADMAGFLGFVVVVSFFAWAAGILATLPVWIVLHIVGLIQPRHAAIVGALAPGVIGILLFQSIGFALFGILGPFVALTIQRVYYGKAAS